jgi:hypothetical protein
MDMNRCIMLLCAVLLPVLVYCQAERFYYADAFYFVKEISVSGHAGKPYRFSIAVKENGADEKSKPRIYSIQVRKGKEDIIGKTLIYATRIGSDWKIYSIEGIIDTTAMRIRFYIAVNGNGDFYFDDLRYALKNNDSAWINQPVLNYSFEGGGKKLLQDYYYKQSAPQLNITSSTESVDGKFSLHIFTAGMKPSTQLLLRNKQ